MYPEIFEAVQVVCEHDFNESMYFHLCGSVCLIYVPHWWSEYRSLVNDVVDLHISRTFTAYGNSCSAFVQLKLYYQEYCVRNPRARSLRRSILELALSKAPETSEQYTAILRRGLSKEIHASTS